MLKNIKSATLIRLSSLLTLFVVVALFRNVEGWGDVYAQNIYPYIAFVLSSISNIFPFSIGELFVSLSILALIGYPFFARRGGTAWKMILFREVEYLGWVYVWFYIAWGLNYSQKGVLERLDIEPLQFSEETFSGFTNSYVSELNASYQELLYAREVVPEWSTDESKQALMEDIVAIYHSIGEEFAINKPLLKEPKVKSMLFSPLSSMVGVSGSMAPFFCEFTVNSDVLPLNYPATYAHEMAHQLGVTSDAEANFYAYQVCTRSYSSLLRFSGYISILPYVLSNARSVLDEKQYRELYGAINPKIIVIAQTSAKYWQGKYSPLLGKIQNYMYNAYLKSNSITSGTKNYSEVIGLLIAVRENEE